MDLYLRDPLFALSYGEEALLITPKYRQPAQCLLARYFHKYGLHGDMVCRSWSNGSNQDFVRPSFWSLKSAYFVRTRAQGSERVRGPQGLLSLDEVADHDKGPTTAAVSINDIPSYGVIDGSHLLTTQGQSCQSALKKVE